ncbi:hypothetical protein RN001_007237 [Aquatica leii]|uniref:Uncharacterized protein n=1 Tax=Aquatica leii TaxID=1421715 RepID=A0AAN7S909_9COLE|nr:hypothetical protein RN001_007237 [Aquatica leii]
MTDSTPVGKRITLHRVPLENKNVQIKENLESLKVNMHPKKLAQKLYYENSGRSPLLRDTITENKLPVHERLGSSKRKKSVFNFNPVVRNKFKRTNTNNNKISNRLNLAQARLQRIRQQRLPENILNNTGLLSKLRFKRAMQSQPINYKILVKNENACRINMLPKMHSVQESLSSNLQQEIKILQLQNFVEPNIIPNAPIVTVGYGFTGVSMNHRFSLLP